MSWRAVGWAKKCRPHSPTHKLALLITADYATEKAGQVGLTVPDGWAVCWATIEEIAADSDLSTRTIKRVFADLEQARIIRRDRRYANNPRYGQPGQPKMVRTSDAVWINYAQPYIDVPADETKHAAKVRAGRLGGKVSAARRAAERDAAREAHNIAAAAVFEALGGPPEDHPEAVPQVPACLPSGDNVLRPQVTPSFTAKPTVEPPVNRQNLACASQVQTARARTEQDQPPVAGPIPQQSPPPEPTAPASARPPHRSNRPSGLRPRRAWIDDGSGPEPERYRRPPHDHNRSNDQ